MFRRAFFSLAALLALACAPLFDPVSAYASGNRQVMTVEAAGTPDAAQVLSLPMTVELKVFGVLAVVALACMVALLIQDRRAMRRLREDAAKPDLFRFASPFARSPPS